MKAKSRPSAQHNAFRPSTAICVDLDTTIITCWNSNLTPYVASLARQQISCPTRKVRQDIWLAQRTIHYTNTSTNDKVQIPMQLIVL